jgi:hypothetical protein
MGELFICCGQAFDLVIFWTADVSVLPCKQLNRDYSFNKNNRCFVVHTTSSDLQFYFLQLYGYIQHGPLDVPSTFVLSKL